MIAVSGVALAGPHPAHYEKRTATLGVAFEINGQSYKLVRIPFKAFDGGKYAIIYPILVTPDSSSFGEGIVRTVHSDKPFASNTTISGFPAKISIEDAREYYVGGDVGTEGTFDVKGLATSTVTIQVGATLVSLNLLQFHQINPDSNSETNLQVGDDVNLTPLAEWPKWRDLKIEATALDTVLDYIQIIAL
jgi:hypothetical protein